MYSSVKQIVASAIKKQIRKIKVGYKFHDRAWNVSVIYPEIKLSGKWLKEAGFNEGQEIKIIVENQKLVIVPIEN